MTHPLRASLLALLLLATPAFAQNAPATRPAVPQLTAEQRDAINAYNHLPTDQPAVKKNMTAYNRDGTPNPNFDKPDAGFIKRHEGFIERSKSPVGLLWIGDSITDGWNTRGKELFAAQYDRYQPANFGIGGDRTEHVLWRIANGELDAIKPNPKVVVIMIGTNDAAAHTPEEIAAGTTAVVSATQAKLPDSKILLLAIFPRQAKPTDELRVKNEKANDILAKLDQGPTGKIRFLSIWKQFLTDDGTLTKQIMPDLLHPNAAGYKIWADAMQPTLDEMMK
jgi:lysophospholipase L1-like esterase